MIGGTAVQTLILAIMTVRCDWEKEVSHSHTTHIIWGYIYIVKLHIKDTLPAKLFQKR
jgi:hypothetical protein